MILDPFSTALISWATSQLGNAGLRGLRRLRGDASQKALQAVVRKAVHDAVDQTVVESNREAVRDSLLSTSPDPAEVHRNDFTDLDEVIERQLQPRLEALTRQGYGFDSHRLAAVVAMEIKNGIESDAARGGQLTPLANLIHHQEHMAELRAVNRTLAERLPLPSISGAGVEFGGLVSGTAVATSIPSDYSAYIQNFLIEYLGRAGAPVPFGGRRSELTVLDDWLSAEHAPPYLMLAGPAGRGKSALIVRWLTQIEQNQAVSVAFVPVSLRFGTASAEVLFPALAVRLGRIYDRPLPPAIYSPSVDWRALVADFLTGAVPEGKKVVIVVDGLDEASGWKPGPDLFPLDPPARLKVVATARYIQGDQDAYNWIERLGWGSSGLATILDLGLLDRAGIADVLEASRVPAREGDLDLAKQLFDLTAGDPLLIGLYVADLLRPGGHGARFIASDLPHVPPGLQGYFDRWLEQQRQLWGEQSPLREPATQSVLRLLAVAVGPLSREDLLNLVPSVDSWALDDIMRSLERFVLGDGSEQGYVFSHPRLAQYFSGRMTTLERQRAVGQFLDWGAATLNDLEAASPSARLPPEYLSLHLADHLSGAGMVDQLLAMGSNRGWADAQLAANPSGATLIHDLHLAFDTAVSADRASAASGAALPALAFELTCALTESTIRSLSHDMPPAILVALIDAGTATPEQALQMAELNPDGIGRIAATVAISDHCLPENEKIAVMRSALESIRMMPASQQERAFMALAAHLPPVLMQLALQVVSDCLDPHATASALVALAPSFDGDMFGQAQSMLEAAFTGLGLAQAFADLVPHAAGSSRDALLDEALAVTRHHLTTDSDPHIALMTLARLTAAAPADVRAGLAAEALAHGSTNVRLIASIARYLPDTEKDQALSDAMRILQGESADTESNSEDLGAFFNIIDESYFPQKFFQPALTAAGRIKSEEARQKALEAIIPRLPHHLLQSALEIACASARLRPQIGIVKRLIEFNDIDAARQVADGIRYWRTRDWGLGLVAEAMAHCGHGEDALALVESLSDQNVKFSSLGWIFDSLSAELRQKAVSLAVSQTTSAEVQGLLSESSLRTDISTLANRFAAVGEYASALELARALPARVEHGPRPRADALADLLQSAPRNALAPTLQEAIEAARAIADYAQQAVALCSIGHLLPDIRRSESSQHALAAALAVPEPATRARILTEIAGDLTSTDHATAIDEIVTCLLTLGRQPGENRMGLHLLKAVVSQLSGSQIKALLPLTSERPQPRTVEETAEAELLAILGQYLPKEFIVPARTRAEGITREEPRVQALVALLPAKGVPGRQKLINNLMAIAESMPAAPDAYAVQRLTALAAIIPTLDETDLARAANLIGAVETSAAQSDEFWTDEYWTDEYWKALTDALVTLGQRQIEAGRPEDALALVMRVENEYRNSGLAVLVPQLPGRLLPQVGRLWETSVSHGTSFSKLSIALARREPSDTEPQRWLITAVAHAAHPYVGDLVALRELTPRLKPAGLAALIRYFQDEATPAQRATGLAHLATHSELPEREQLFEMAMQSLESLGSEYEKETVFSTIAEVLPDSLLPRAAALATSISYFSVLAPRLAQLPRPQLQPIWEEIFRNLAAQERRNFLTGLSVLPPLLAALTDADGIERLWAESIDILSHWP